MDVYPNNSSNVYFNCNMMSNRQIWGNPVFRFDMTHGLFFFSTSAIFDPPITRWCPSALANLRTSSLGESTMVYGRYIYTIYIDLTSHYQLCLSMSIYTIYVYLYCLFIHQHPCDNTTFENPCSMLWGRREFANQGSHPMKVPVVKFPVWQLKNDMLGGVNPNCWLLNHMCLTILLLILVILLWADCPQFQSFHSKCWS